MIFSDLFLWTAQIGYLLSLIPQILINKKQRSGKGVSQLLLFGYLNGYLCWFYYIFFFNLPFAYKVLVPPQMIATGLLIWHRVYYDKEWLAGFLYAINIAFFIALFPFVKNNPHEWGSAMGWASLVWASVNLLPQVIKIHMEKSVVGFSFSFVLFNLLATSSEALGALFCGLPIQSLLSGIRGILFCLVFIVQFVLYRE